MINNSLDTKCVWRIFFLFCKVLVFCGSLLYNFIGDNMKKVFFLVLMIILVTGCSFKDLFVRENKKIEYLSGKHNIEMKVKDYGIIELELDADTAPITVTNFMPTNHTT